MNEEETPSLRRLKATARCIRARELLYQMALDGLAVEVTDDNRLWVGPGNLVTDWWRGMITEYRSEILQELRR